MVIHEGTLKTLKRFKDEVSEVQSGQECGMAFENYDDIRKGDVIARRIFIRTLKKIPGSEDTDVDMRMTQVMLSQCFQYWKGFKF